MSEEELFEALRPIRVPEEFARFDLLDFLVIGAFGALLCWFILWCIAKLRVKELSPDEKLQGELDALKDLGRDEQILGFARLWGDYAEGAPLPEALHAGLYDPEARFDLEPYAAWIKEVRA